MIQCTKCKEWFHRQCAGLVPRPGRQWRSKGCIWHCGRCKNRSDLHVNNVHGLYDICILCCIAVVVIYNGLKCIPPQMAK